MEILEVGEAETKTYISQAKEALTKGPLTIKGVDRNSVNAVNLAEALKAENHKVIHIKLETEEREFEGKKRRISIILIEMEK